MSEQTRKTQARMAERERRRQQQEQKEKLFKVIPFGIIAILVLVGVGLIVYGNMASPIAGGIGPRLEVDRDQIDLGTRKFDQPVRATFKVKNAGDNTLNLSVPKLVTAVEGC
ncbi:MAG: hypothetical protein A2Z03_11335 [Chloroflexi bacterium RBG_16_56_8]|nr:MAG: hypothetical protein A2Z03_11335 [Chloroflexi bacterium RBG_16_56_8]